MASPIAGFGSDRGVPWIRSDCSVNQLSKRKLPSKVALINILFGLLVESGVFYASYTDDSLCGKVLPIEVKIHGNKQRNWLS